MSVVAAIFAALLTFFHAAQANHVAAQPLQASARTIHVTAISREHAEFTAHTEFVAHVEAAHVESASAQPALSVMARLGRLHARRSPRARQTSSPAQPMLMALNATPAR